MSKSGFKVQLDGNASYNSGRSPEVVQQQVSLAEALGNEEKITSKTLVEQAQAFNQAGQYDQAQIKAQQALSRVEEENLSFFDKQSIHVSATLCLANVARENGDVNASMELFKKAQQLNQALLSEIEKRRLDAINNDYVIARNLGIACLMRKEFREAMTHFSSILERVVDTENINTPRYLALQAYYYLCAIQCNKSRVDLLLLKGLVDKYTDKSNMDYMALCNHLGIAYQVMNQPKKAEPYFREALRLRLSLEVQKIGAVYFHNRVGDSRVGLAEVLLQQNSLEKFREGKTVLAAAQDNFMSLLSQSERQVIQDEMEAQGGNAFFSELQHFKTFAAGNRVLEKLLAINTRLKTALPARLSQMPILWLTRARKRLEEKKAEKHQDTAVAARNVLTI